MKHSPAFLRRVDALRAQVQEIDAKDLPQRLAQTPEAIVIDVREDREWDAGHLRDAIHLGKGVIERDIESAVPERDAPLFLYCGGGFRSVIAADSLQQMGYRNVWSVDGGWKALRELLPCEQG